MSTSATQITATFAIAANAATGARSVTVTTARGTSNAKTFTIITAQVATPTFAPPAGAYGSAQSVTISTATAGASIRYTTDGSIPSSTVGNMYSGPVAVSSNLTLKAIAYKSGMTDSAVASAAYTITTGGANTAVFVKTDTATQGTWKGVYGANGYNVIDNTISYPAYVTVTPAGQLNYIWASSTSDVRGLQKVLSSTDRVAATWYTSSSFTIDLNFTDGHPHQLAVYCLDWDTGGARAQTVSILNGATNTVLDSQNLSSFQNGKYLVWKLSGHVVLQVTKTGGANAVISGLFFDPPATGSTVATPTFSPPAGSYGSAQSVTISTTTAGASIRYTTDGSTPSSTVGTPYNGPVSVSTNLTLKAIALRGSDDRQRRGLSELHHPSGHTDVQSAGGELWFGPISEHQHDHCGGLHPLHHRWIDTQFHGGNGLRQPGFGGRQFDPESHRLRGRDDRQCGGFSELHHPGRGANLRTASRDVCFGAVGDDQHHHCRRLHPLHH